MVAEWYCQVMGSEVGPLTQRELVDMVRNHRINPEDLIRRNKSSWVAAFEVRGLFEAAAKPSSSSSSSDAAKAKVTETPPDRSPSQALAEKRRVRRDRAHSHPAPLAKSSPKPASPLVNHTETEAIHDWFCIASGEKRGPLGFEELQAMACDGSLRGRDRVWRASWPKFQKAADVEGLDV